MNTEDRQDWLDRAIDGDGLWEPPAHFVQRVATHAMAALPRRLSVKERLVATFSGLRESVRARLEGSVWVVRQYRDLLLHS